MTSWDRMCPGRSNPSHKTCHQPPDARSGSRDDDISRSGCGRLLWISLLQVGHPFRRNRTMRAPAYRPFALALLLPLGVSVEPASAGLVGGSNHVLGIVEFDLLAARAFEASPFAFNDEGRNGAYAPPAIFGDPVLSSVLLTTSYRTFDVGELSSPVANYGHSSSISGLLTETTPATAFTFTTADDRIAAEPLGTDLTLAKDSLYKAFADGVPTSFTVPEPTVILLLAAGIPAIIGRRPRRRT